MSLNERRSQLSDASFTAHKSFRGELLRGGGDILSFMYQRERDQEVALARKALADVSQFDSLVAKANTGEFLSVEEASHVAAVEASVIYLEDPLQISIHPLTPCTFRQIRIFELTGVLNRASFQGDILLIGSGATQHEIQALNAKVAIHKTHEYRTAALRVCDLLAKHKVNQDNGMGFVEEFLTLHKECVATTELELRLSMEQKVVAVEPSEKQINGFLAQANRYPHPFNICSLSLLPMTMGEFFTLNETGDYSLIMARRVDPNSWTDALVNFGTPETTRFLRPLGASDGVGEPNVHKMHKKIYADLQPIIQSMATIVHSGSQLYISVGSGNNAIDPREAEQRGVFMGETKKLFAGKGMPTKFFIGESLAGANFVRSEGELELAVLVADFNSQALQRLGAKSATHDSLQGEVHSGKKRRRRR